MINDSTMNIEAESGSLVRFSYPHNAYTHQQEKAANFLTIDEVYTVEKTIIHSWSSDVFLKEFPGEPFNTVLFSDV